MKISQREARRMRKELTALRERERQRNATWATDYPGGVNFTTINLGVTHEAYIAIRTAKKLSHAVVARADDGGYVYFYALPQREAQDGRTR